MKDLALKIIRKSFADKLDKAGQPYINHLIRVSDKIKNKGLHENIVIVALLHDLLEDCPEWNEKSLRIFFFDSIVDSVVALTHKPQQSYHDYITQVMDDRWAIAVKEADLEDNMDITRLPELTKEDIERLKKYHAAYLRIK